MNSSAFICLVCTVLLAVVLGTAGCTSVSPGDTGVAPVSTVTTPADSASGSSCGFTTCHGLDLACGADAPDICTMEYQLGDKCRQYARCDTGGGSCTLVTSPEFDSCASCVKQCKAKAGSDVVSAFECEETC